MRRFAAGLVMLAVCGSALAQPAPESPNLDNPQAFERGFAESLYLFDACGDPLAGRIYRRALADRFAHCPFTTAARTRYQQHTRAQFAKMRETMDNLIEQHGGLPMQLKGMTRTCHEQQADDGYREYRGQLEQYSGGSLPAEQVIGAACDAEEITR